MGQAGAVLCGFAAVLAVANALLPADPDRAEPAAAAPATRATLIAVLLVAIGLLVSVPDSSLSPDWWRYVSPVELLSNPYFVTLSFLAVALASFWLRVRSAVAAWTITRISGISWIDGLEHAESPAFADTVCAAYTTPES